MISRFSSSLGWSSLAPSSVRALRIWDRLWDGEFIMDLGMVLGGYSGINGADEAQLDMEDYHSSVTIARLAKREQH